MDSALFTSPTFDAVVKLTAAFLMALPIAWEREQATRIMGLRTFPLVAIGSCAYMLIGLSDVDPGSDAAMRLIQGLIAGIGFLGGGAILKEEDRVKGTATAASVWVIGAVGAAVGFGRYDIAICIVVANFVILRLLGPLKIENAPGE